MIVGISESALGQQCIETGVEYVPESLVSISDHSHWISSHRQSVIYHKVWENLTFIRTTVKFTSYLK